MKSCGQVIEGEVRFAPTPGPIQHRRQHVSDRADRRGHPQAHGDVVPRWTSAPSPPDSRAATRGGTQPSRADGGACRGDGFSKYLNQILEVNTDEGWARVSRVSFRTTSMLTCAR